MTHVTRRRFLGTATGGVGAVAAGAWPAGAGQAGTARAAAEIAVIGAGAFGGWTALYLREMGHAVTLIDQYGPGNARATSGGESRQIRAVYGEREIYTKWVIEAFDRWQAREAEWGKKLFFRTGQLSLAPDWTKELTDTRKVFDRLGIKYDLVKLDDLVRQYPQMNMNNVGVAMYTPSTGVLKAREGCVAVAQAFEKKGGRFITARAELGARAGRALQNVSLSNGQRVSAQTFVFACGPWLPKVFPSAMKGKLITPRRAVFFYGTPPGDERFTYPNFPTWSVDNAYGFPSIEGRGFKVVPTFERELVDPDTQEHSLTGDELRKGRAFREMVSAPRPTTARRRQDLPARGQHRRALHRAAAPGAGQRLARRRRIRARLQTRHRVRRLRRPSRHRPGQEPRARRYLRVESGYVLSHDRKKPRRPQSTQRELSLRSLRSPPFLLIRVFIAVSRSGPSTSRRAP